ncbi:MAG: hypothetical protein ACXWUG_23745 [Polyangiales bacterium]
MPDDTNTAPDPGAEGTGAPEAPPQPPTRRRVEQWEADKGVDPWLRVAARALNRWPLGRELLEEEFDAGVKRAADLALR